MKFYVSEFRSTFSAVDRGQHVFFVIVCEKAGFQDPGSSIFKGILFRVGGESEIDPGPNGFSDGGQIHTDEYS